MVPKELIVRYKGSADEIYHWYREQYPELLKTMGLPVTSMAGDDATHTLTCEFASFGGNSATFRYTVSPAEDLEDSPTASVRLETTVRKSMLFGADFESKMLGLFMITDQVVGQQFPVVAQ